MTIHPWSRHGARLLLVAGILLLLRLTTLPGNYPYYAFWDMDQVTAVDLVLLNSRLVPDHIHHPGGAMYLLQNLLLRLYDSVGWLSVQQLADLAAASNPVAAMAELIDQLRQWSAWVNIATALLLWRAVIAQRPLAAPLRALLLLVLASASFLTYHSSLIRTESYAAFWWAAALLLAVHAQRGGAGRRGGLLALHGLCLGLAVCAKIQVLFLLPLPYLLARLANPYGSAPLRAFWMPWVSATALLLAPLPWVIELPVMAQGGAFLLGASFGPNPLFLALAAALPGLLLLRTQARWQTLAHDLPVILGGFLLAPWLIALASAELSFGLHYSLHMYKIALWRPFPVQDFTSGAPLLLHDWQITLLVVISFALLTKVLRQRERFLQHAGSAALILALLILQAAIGSRPLVRDLLWLELGGLAAALSWLALSWKNLDRRQHRLLVLVLLVTLAANLKLSLAIPTTIAAIHNHYTFDTTRIVYPVLDGNNYAYVATVAGRLQGDQPASPSPRELPDALQRPRLTGPLHAAIQQAGEHGEIRRVVEASLPGSQVDWGIIGVAVAQAPVWKGDAARFADIPAPFLGATSVDLATPGRASRWAYRPNRRQEEAESFEYFSWQRIDEVIVMPRNDYSTHLFLSEVDYRTLTRKEPSGPPLRIQTAHGMQPYYGYWIERVTLVPAARLAQPALLLLQPTRGRPYSP